VGLPVRVILPIAFGRLQVELRGSIGRSGCGRSNFHDNNWITYRELLFVFIENLSDMTVAMTALRTDYYNSPTELYIMSKTEQFETNLTVLANLPPASGSLDAVFGAHHPTFKSQKVFFRTTQFDQVEISAVDNDRHWVFNFDKSITPNTYLIGDQAIKRIWYVQENPNQIYTPAPIIGKIQIIEIDLAKGILKAHFDFSIWRESQGQDSIADAKGTIDVWDLNRTQL
jgi:hypothetical protein